MSIKRMAGLALAIVPIRVQVDWQGNIKGLLETVHGQATVMVPFEQTSLHQIRQASDEAVAAYDFRVLLVVQSAIKKGEFHYKDSNSQARVERLVAGKDTIAELSRRSRTYHMYGEAQLDTDGDVYLRLCFNSGIVGEVQVERMIKQLENALRQLSNAEGNGVKLRNLVEFRQFGAESNACRW